MGIEADRFAETMFRAHGLIQAGDFTAGAKLCREVLARDPAHFSALLMLGIAEREFRRFGEAEKFLARAIRSHPRSPEALTLYGDTLSELARHEEAIKALGRALALRPNDPTALLYRGIACAQAMREEEALADFGRVLAYDPHSIFALHNRANVLIGRRRLAEARRDVEALLKIAPGYIPAISNRALLMLRDGKAQAALHELDRALTMTPEDAGLHYTRGMALARLERRKDALAAYDRALAIGPIRTEFHVGRGLLLVEMTRNDEALASYQAALAMDPHCVPALLNRGQLALDGGDFDEARLSCEKAIARAPGHAPALLLRGHIFLHLGRGKDAVAAYDAALEAEPDYAETHYHRGAALLLHGRFEEGWREWEHRWDLADRPFSRPALQAKEWRGEDLTGKSVVVFAEQGLGDAIMFVRFLPLLAARGARVAFLCHANLTRLFAPFADRVELLTVFNAKRHYDYQCALMSLPERLGLDGPQSAGPIPYLFAEEEKIAAWRGRIGGDGFRIGINWQGNPAGQIDKGRSIPLASFQPLAAQPSVRLISLQKTHGLAQLGTLPEAMRVETPGAFDSAKDAFLDTAAIVKNLDLVVTSDTSLAHLAGALGVPVWVALKRIPDWRWMLAGENSPWYPSMRLFRQTAHGDWASVFTAMAEALPAHIRAKDGVS